MEKKAIVAVLEEIAVLLELKGENPFKIRAYQNGARALEQLTEDLSTVITEERLAEVPGMGKALAEKIETLHASGKLEYHEKLRASVPPGLLEMIEVPGLGGKRIKKIYDALGVDTLDSLEAACQSGALAELPGFGQKTAENILRGLKNLKAYSARHLWWDASERALPLLAELRALPEVTAAEAAGSLRRYRETVGDLDFIVASTEPAPIMDWFTARPGILEVTARGETKSSVRFEDGLQADIRVVPPAQYPFALHHFTGSKEHNVLMRQRALQRGYSLSEWGLSEVPPEDRRKNTISLEGKAEGIASEADLFAALGLAFIPPELREGRTELELAEQGGFPDLVDFEDLRGVFHNHTTASDGSHSLEQMTAAAEALGWEYLGIADHSKASFQANGLDEARVRKQLAEIRSLNASGKFKVHVFAGIECDILSDGRLDLEDDLLAELDYVVASVHSGLGQDEEKMTARLVRALEHPATTMLGHPTGRLLLRREAAAVDFNKVIDAAAANGKFIELNCNPWRMDMDWRLWRRAADRGILCSINPDAHDTEHFAYTRLGIGAARKAGLSKSEVLNTRSLAAVKEALG
jgi:DNA polymerase (family 10)